MHNAPPVTFCVGRSSFWLVLNSALWVIGVIFLGVWFAVSRFPLYGLFLLCLLMVLTALMSWTSWQKMPEGTLSWQGNAWTWLPRRRLVEDSDITLTLHWDGQHVMLLKLRPNGSSAFWLCVTRHADPSKWLDFRRAVYSRGKAKLAGLSASTTAMPNPGNVTPS